MCLSLTVSLKELNEGPDYRAISTMDFCAAVWTMKGMREEEQQLLLETEPHSQSAATLASDPARIDASADHHCQP